MHGSRCQETLCGNQRRSARGAEMDTEILVGSQFDVGRRLVGQIIRDGFDVSVAFWVKTSEEGLWHLYIASPAVDEARLVEAYRKVYASLSKTPDSAVSLPDIKLIN